MSEDKKPSFTDINEAIDKALINLNFALHLINDNVPLQRVAQRLKRISTELRNSKGTLAIVENILSASKDSK